MPVSFHLTETKERGEILINSGNCLSEKLLQSGGTFEKCISAVK